MFLLKLLPSQITFLSFKIYMSATFSLLACIVILYKILQSTTCPNKLTTSEEVESLFLKGVVNKLLCLGKMPRH